MNQWQRFLRNHKGSGKTITQLSADYKKQKGAVVKKNTHTTKRGLANLGGVFPRVTFDRGPVPTGLFVGRGSWDDALEGSELDVSLVNTHGQDRLRVYDMRKKRELGFIRPNDSLVIQPENRQYQLTWTSPVDDRGRIDFENHAIEKQTLKIAPMKK